MAFTAIPDKAAGDDVTLAMWHAIRDDLNGGVMRPIADSGVLGASAATVTFSSIATTWDDLMLVGSYRSTAAGPTAVPRLYLNNDTGSNYDHAYVSVAYSGSATTTVASTAATTRMLAAVGGPCSDASAGNFGMFTATVLHYQSGQHKHVNGWACHFEGGSVFRDELHGLWRSTSVVNRIDLDLSSGSWEAGSRFVLYGIAGV